MRKPLLMVLFSFLISAPVYANWLLVCPTNTAEIENQLESNWSPSKGAWYTSYAQVEMGNVRGTGGVRGPMDNSMPNPHDRHPHLQFTSLSIQDDADRGEVEIDCQYLIVHNPEVFDRNYPSLTSVDNVFWMKGFLIGSKNQCRQLSRDTVSCYA